MENCSLLLDSIVFISVLSCDLLGCAIFELAFFVLEVGILGTKFQQYLRLKEIKNWSLYVYMAARFGY